MNLCEKLQFLRKSQGYTQEKLAEEMQVSRQAVAKWESGMACPDIENLLRISDLFHVTVDYLVRRQACEMMPARAAENDIKALIRFRLKANGNTYAAYMNEVSSTRLDSHDFHYEEGEWAYHDTYVGGEQFAGEEAVWKAGRAVYAMNYSGRVLGAHFSGHFLKEALRAADEGMPYRGPEYYSRGEYVYKCRVNGDVQWFQGHEEMLCRGEKVYECFFHGGLMK